jgi:hypothetical protein
MVSSVAPLGGLASKLSLVAAAGSSWSSQKYGRSVAPAGSSQKQAGSAMPGELLPRLNAWVLALLSWPGLSTFARELCGLLAVGICVMVVVLPSFALILGFLQASLGSTQLYTSCGSLPPGYAANSALLCTTWNLGLYQVQGLSLAYRYRGLVARTVLLWTVLCFSLTLALAALWVPRLIAEGPVGIVLLLAIVMMGWLNITLPPLINSVSKMPRLRALPVAKRGLLFAVLGLVTVLMGVSPQGAVLAAKHFSGIYDLLISGLFMPVFVWCVRRAVTISYAPFLESSTGERKVDLNANMSLLTKVYVSVPQSFILLTLDYGTFFGAALSSALFELGACALLLLSEEREQRRHGKRRRAQEQHLEQHRDLLAAPAHAQVQLSQEQDKQQARQGQAHHLQQQEQQREQQQQEQQQPVQQQQPEQQQPEQQEPEQQQPEQQQPDEKQARGQHPLRSQVQEAQAHTQQAQAGQALVGQAQAEQPDRLAQEELLHEQVVEQQRVLYATRIKHEDFAEKCSMLCAVGTALCTEMASSGELLVKFLALAALEVLCDYLKHAYLARHAIYVDRATYRIALVPACLQLSSIVFGVISSLKIYCAFFGRD